MEINITMGMNTSPRKSRQIDGFYDYISVAGINHYQYAYDKFVENNLPMSARYEPTNEYDENAIAIYGGNRLIGYVPRRIAEKVAYLPEEDKERLAIRETSRDKYGCVFSLYFSDDEDANYIQHPKTTNTISGNSELDSGSCFYAFVFIISIITILCLSMQF